MANRTLVSLYPEATLALEKRWEPCHREAEETYGSIDTMFDMPVYYRNPIGLEIECEGVREGVKPIPFSLWRSVDDPSLRGPSFELVSIPLFGKYIDYALCELKEIRKHFGDMNFTHRTSVHVHVNVSKYTQNHLTTLLALYAMLEEVYYGFADPIRSGNTYCYRLVGSPLECRVLPPGEGRHTTKYCSLNIAPIARQMTVEFRHLDGTLDPLRLRRWIQICTKLVNYVDSLAPKTCATDLIESIKNREVATKLVPAIWGETAKIFTPEVINESISIGESWALNLLLKEKR